MELTNKTEILKELLQTLNAHVLPVHFKQMTPEEKQEWIEADEELVNKVEAEFSNLSSEEIAAACDQTNCERGWITAIDKRVLTADQMVVKALKESAVHYAILALKTEMLDNEQIMTICKDKKSRHDIAILGIQSNKLSKEEVMELWIIYKGNHEVRNAAVKTGLTDNELAQALLTVK